MDKLETELKNQREPGFQPGVSGNPTGKPKGARCRVTVLAEKLMADNAQDIIQATIDAAKNGDSVAMRLCVERLVPIRKWVPSGGSPNKELAPRRSLTHLLSSE